MLYGIYSIGLQARQSQQHISMGLDGAALQG
jgi:hypothetical protein